jgi:hypothetical protein
MGVMRRGAAATLVAVGMMVTAAHAQTSAIEADHDEPAASAVAEEAAPPAFPVVPALSDKALSPLAPLTLRRQGDALELSANLRFDLPSPVRDALSKGLPVMFSAEAEIYRPRWWWFDERVSYAQRQWRLVYQPLTQRWRVSVSSSSVGRANGTGGAALAQSFDSLDEALAVIRHVARWRVADASAIAAGESYRLEFLFHLDTDALSRPLQIGALGDEDWDLDVSLSRIFQAQSLE